MTEHEEQIYLLERKHQEEIDNKNATIAIICIVVVAILCIIIPQGAPLG